MLPFLVYVSEVRSNHCWLCKASESCIRLPTGC